jgi:hypothetical protein
MQQNDTVSVQNIVRAWLNGEKVDRVHNNFNSALFGQLSLELLVVGQEDRVEVTHLFQLILEKLSFGESLYCDYQKLIFRTRVLHQFLYEKGSRY